MIPWEQLRESSIYQHILEEGREEGLEKGKLEGVRETLLDLIAQRFPALEISQQINSIEHFATLKQLCTELFQLKDEQALRQRILELTQ